MSPKTKIFDCVEMKRRIQQELLAEYEARRDEFASYAEFIRVTARQDPEIRRWRQRHAATQSEGPPAE